MATKKAAPAKSATAKKAPAAAKKTAATKAAPAKKRAVKKVEKIDYRLLAMQKALAVIDDAGTRERAEKFCVALVQEAHLLALARTDDGIAYRKHLGDVSDACRLAAWAVASEDEDRIEDAHAGLVDELNYSPFSDRIDTEFDRREDREAFRLVESIIHAEEIDLAFTIRGRD
ncbi:hypothetical protein FHT39_000335 [Mitsuaria sp. BK045]|uniref:hypothetical protein n=1 Tax=unclassified Roseateles TaxID=2626991 RepID=UPI00160D8DCF|nr:MULTISPECIES: hypothetical protein [unclassified Roseateles]MBB3291696.1 hypothetical protein [Mitsuaria sp. BK041]MBB3360913.1 hypothetical protein [Mitsuaria sp. BK045]